MKTLHTVKTTGPVFVLYFRTVENTQPAFVICLRTVKKILTDFLSPGHNRVVTIKSRIFFIAKVWCCLGLYRQFFFSVTQMVENFSK